MPEKIKSKVVMLKKWSNDVLATASYRQKLLILIGVAVVSYGIAFMPQAVAFSHSEPNCYARATLFPSLFQSSGDGFEAKHVGGLSIGSFQLFSSRICIEPTKATKDDTKTLVRSGLFGLPLFQHMFAVSVQEVPVLLSERVPSEIATTRPLDLPLSTGDRVHDYRLVHEAKVADCDFSEAGAVRCDVPALKLDQGKEYELSLNRFFKNAKVETMSLGEVETLAPVEINKTSIKQDATVYAKPTKFTLETNKPLDAAEAKLYVVKADKRDELASKMSLSDATITLEADKQLPRSADIIIELSQVEGQDGSTLLDETYELSFKTSGGPKVEGVSVGASGIAQSEAIRIQFDQELSDEQTLSDLVEVAGVAATLSRQGSEIIVQLQGADLCKDLTITTDKSIQSKYGIGGDGAWTFKTRTICYTTSVIGSTVNGAPITAYSFGNGSDTALFVGLTHGNEQSTYQLMSAWIDELERGATTIPDNKKVVVVPALNRDSLASGARTNARGIDLNRNFPTADWKRDVKMPSGEVLKNGGGKSALSEPETQAIANFTQQLNPYIVLTYHSVGGFVSPNEAGQSSALARTYASHSGYWVSAKGESESVFDYDTTGAYEDWLYEGPGIAAILIELGSHSYANTDLHFPAMWAMIR